MFKIYKQIVLLKLQCFIFTSLKKMLCHFLPHLKFFIILANYVALELNSVIICNYISDLV